MKGRHKVFKTGRYTIYYLFDDVELENAEKKIVKGNHEFLYFGDVIVIKPRQISRAQ